MAASAGGTQAYPPVYRADIPSINDTISVKSLGTLSVRNAGFASFLDQDGQTSLFVSSFAALLGDAVYRIDGLTSSTQVGGLDATKLSGSVTWPNDIRAAPAEVFGSDGIVVGGGFLVPGKTDGGIYFSASGGPGGSSGPLVRLTTYPGWFYHRVLFADMDNDGVLDMVSCRAAVGLLRDQTMLVVLRPSDPADPAAEDSWVETEIGPGCDALFAVEDLDGDGIPEVVAPSYFTEQLNLFHSSSPTGFADPRDVVTVLLDGGVGAAFDVQVVDVDGDGARDLLVSNHQGDGTGGVYAYEIPRGDITDASAYTRHTLAEGFPVTQKGQDQASPGSPVAFFPTAALEAAGGAPYIAIAGDAAQVAYVLVPGRRDWVYTTTLLHDCGCTVGYPAVADVDGDGYVEIVVPCYDDGIIAAYTFAP